MTQTLLDVIIRYYYDFVIQTYALDDLVKPRSLVACSNLVVRSTEHASCPTLAFNELSTLTLKPREPYLRTALDYLNDNIQVRQLIIIFY